MRLICSTEIRDMYNAWFIQRNHMFLNRVILLNHKVLPSYVHECYTWNKQVSLNEYFILQGSWYLDEWIHTCCYDKLHFFDHTMSSNFLGLHCGIQAPCFNLNACNFLDCEKNLLMLKDVAWLVLVVDFLKHPLVLLSYSLLKPAHFVASWSSIVVNSYCDKHNKSGLIVFLLFPDLD